MIPIERTIAGLRGIVRGLKAEGAAIGVVPTMGALHAGHASLVTAARPSCDRVIVTIFVNPAQFGDPADLAKYPRTEAADAALLAPLGVDLIFAPAASEVYPPGFASRVSVGALADPLEGAARPGHFDAVATVVAKLFGMTGADRAYFGEKDWQQLQVVRRMARDLNLGTEVVGCPTMREADGLAMSSRNARLSPEARRIAGVLPRVMETAAQAMRDGSPDATARAADHLLAAGFDAVDYVEVRDAETLLPASDPARPRRLLVAARVGGVRLIDNIDV